MAFLWNNVPTLFEETKSVSQRPALNKIWVLLFVASSVAFIVLFALDVNHLQCPISEYSTTCVTKDDFGADPNGADKAFCNQLVSASCTGTDNSPDSYFQTVQLIGSSLTACQAQCSCFSSFCANYPLISSVNSNFYKGRSLVNYPQSGYGVSTVTGPQTCQAFASALKSYYLWLFPSPLTSEGPAPNFGCSNLPGCAFNTPFEAALIANGFGPPPSQLIGGSIPTTSAPRPSTAKIRCCGTVTGVGVCPGLASVVGILAGYLSLWFTIMSGTFKLIVLCMNRRDDQQFETAKLANETSTQHMQEHTKSHDQSNAASGGSGARVENVDIEMQSKQL
jgi:hypothetical protein